MLDRAVSHGHMPVGLTNMGPIPERVTDFDGPADDAWLIVPPARAPHLVVGLSGYGGGLCLTCGYSAEATGFDVPGFLADIAATLGTAV